MQAKKSGAWQMKLLSLLAAFLLVAVCPPFLSAEGVGLTAFSAEADVSGDVAEVDRVRPAHRFDLGEVRKDPDREWTLIVYMDGDNDLEPFALADLNEMEAGIGERMEIIVLVDRAKGYDKSEGDWQDARVYRIQKDKNSQKISSELLATPGELNLGDEKVLEGFVGAALKTFPAKHYALIMWNHGGGWAAHASDQDAPGTLNGEDYLTLPELSGAIRGALKYSGVKRLDLIGFDMCLMAQLETVVELKDLAEVMVASQANEPGNGWPYIEVLGEFAKGTQGVRRIASSIVQEYGKFYEATNETIYTLSSFDLTQVDRVTEALDRLADKLGTGLDGLWPTISRSFFFAEAYAARTQVQRGKYALASIDLMDALKRVKTNAKGFNADKEYNDLLAAMDRFILTTYVSPAHRLSNGIAIYSPVTDKIFNDKYLQTRFAQGSHWTKLLQNLYRYQARNQTKPVIHDLKLVEYGKKRLDPATVAKPLSTQGILYTVEGTNLLWLSGMFGEKSEDGKRMIIYSRSTVLDANWHKRIKTMAADKVDYIIPEYKDGTNQRIIMYSGYRYALSNGKKAFYATVTMPLNSGMMAVPIIYEHPSTGKLGGTIYFDDKWWAAKVVVLELPQKDGTVLYQQVKPAPDAKITPLFETINEEGKVDYLQAGTMQWGDGLELLLSLYDPGTYQLALTAEAIGGLSDTALYDFRVDEDKDLRSLIERGKKYTKEDLVGTWQYIDAKQYMKNGTIVPLDLMISFAPHPDDKALLVSRMTAPKRPNYEQVQVVLPDTRTLPHLRFFMVSDKKKIDQPDYSVYMTLIFKTPQGDTVMLQHNLLSQGIYAAVKRGQGGAKPAQSASPQPQAAAVSSSPAGIEGSWRTADGERLIVQGSSYRIAQNGQEIDSGSYRIQGNTLLAKSRYTGVTTQFTFRAEGNTLQLQDAFGERYTYHRESADAAVPQQQSAHTAIQAGSQNGRLRGKYCSYSGSSGTYTGSYSSSNWAYFDGRGSFSYGASSYSSGSAGSYAGGNGGNRGTYSVEGNRIILRFPDGSSDQATVYNQRGDGTITEVSYGGQVYAGALCD